MSESSRNTEHATLPANHKIILWADDSEPAKDLLKRLADRGLPAQHILTGDPEPFLQVGYRFVSGYPNINYAFLS